MGGLLSLARWPLKNGLTSELAKGYCYVVYAVLRVFLKLSFLVSSSLVCECKLSAYTNSSLSLSLVHIILFFISLFPPSDDCVIITEQTLDQQSFIVINQRSGDKGRVPVDYIRIGKPKETSENRWTSAWNCLLFNLTSDFRGILWIYQILHKIRLCIWTSVYY